MKTINQVVRLTGTAAERALLVDKDVDDNTILEFTETDTGDKYEWDGDSWTKISSAGSTYVAPKPPTEYTTAQRLALATTSLYHGLVVKDTTLNKAMVYEGDGTTNVAADWRYEQQHDSYGAALTDSPAYSVKIDDTGTYTYVGKALPGSLTSESVWSIYRMVNLTGDILWSNAGAFTSEWDERAGTETYE